LFSGLLAEVAHLRRRPSQYVHTNLFVTPSGMLSHRYLQWAKEILGAERILFATDYPYVPLAPGAVPEFLDRANLTEGEREQVGWQNWPASEPTSGDRSRLTFLT
jgi:uncharacterized protein